MGRLKTKGRAMEKAGRGKSKFPPAAERLRTWGEAHQNWILGVILAALIVVGGFWGFKAHKASMESRADVAYAAEVLKWPAGDNAEPEKFMELIPGLEAFVRQYDGTRAAVLARLDMAQACFRAGRYEDAAKAGKDALKELSSNDDMKAMAYYQLVLACQALGKPDEAMAQWDIVKNGALSGMEREIRWRQGMFYASRQEYPKAVEQFDLAAKARGSYPSDALIDAELSGAKAKNAGAAADSSKKGS